MHMYRWRMGYHRLVDTHIERESGEKLELKPETIIELLHLFILRQQPAEFVYGRHLTSFEKLITLYRLIDISFSCHELKDSVKNNELKILTACVDCLKL